MATGCGGLRLHPAVGEGCRRWRGTGRVMRAPEEPALTQGRRRAQQRQSEVRAAATAEYRRLSPFVTGDKLAVSGEVNQMIAAAINANPQSFWHRPDA